MPADLTPSFVCPHFPFNCCRMPTPFSILKPKPFLLSNWQPGYCKPIHFTVPQCPALGSLILISRGNRDWSGRAALIEGAPGKLQIKGFEPSDSPSAAGTAASTDLTRQVRRGRYWEGASLVYHFCFSKKIQHWGSRTHSQLLLGQRDWQRCSWGVKA